MLPSVTEYVTPISRPPRRVRLIGLLVIVALAASGAVLAGVVSLKFMESAEFCGLCHTMAPEVHANEQSPHNKVECAGCHVAPGIGGLVQAKINGTRQLFQILTNTYERPIPPAAHLMLQSAVSENCKQCHADIASRNDSLVVKRHFAQDEANTEQDIGLVVKLGSASGTEGRGIHWHVQSRVEYLASDPETQREIDYIRVTSPSGNVTEYASQTSGSRLAQAGPAEGLQTMTCINCHNRAGHELVSPDQAIDKALASRELDKNLPFVKREGLALLTASYPSTQAAEAAIGELPNFYRQTYPTLYNDETGAIETATRVLQDLYPGVARPEMEASYKDYPNFLGHTDGAGCFRCHDGKHVKLDSSGTPTSVTIPSQCSTCHTPPQMGDTSSPESLVGIVPASHKTRMRTDHPAIIREEGGTARCQLCHQSSSCSTCHAADVLHERPLVSTPR